MVQIYSNDVIILSVIKFKSDRDLAYCHSLMMMITFLCGSLLRELVWGQRAQPTASKIDLNKLKSASMTSSQSQWPQLEDQLRNI